MPPRSRSGNRVEQEQGRAWQRSPTPTVVWAGGRPAGVPAGRWADLLPLGEAVSSGRPESAPSRVRLRLPQTSRGRTRTAWTALVRDNPLRVRIRFRPTGVVSRAPVPVIRVDFVVENELMKRGRRAPIGLLVALVGVDLLALGVYFALTGVGQVNGLASVIGVVTGTGGLVVSGYGVMLARRALKQRPTDGRRLVDRMAARSDTDIGDGVCGTARLGAAGDGGTAGSPALGRRPSQHGDAVTR